MSTVAERCLSMIANQKSIPAESVRLEQSLEELNFDSLDKVSLVFDIEEEFGLTITDAEVASLKTVGDIIHGVTHKTSLMAEPT